MYKCPKELAEALMEGKALEMKAVDSTLRAYITGFSIHKGFFGTNGYSYGDRLEPLKPWYPVIGEICWFRCEDDTLMIGHYHHSQSDRFASENAFRYFDRAMILYRGCAKFYSIKEKDCTWEDIKKRGDYLE